MLDGVYVRDADGKLVFHALPPPTTDDVTEVAVRTAKRLQRVLARHGRLLVETRDGRLFAKHGLGPRPPPPRAAPTGQLRLALSTASG